MQSLRDHFVKSTTCSYAVYLRVAREIGRGQVEDEDLAQGATIHDAGKRSDYGVHRKYGIQGLDGVQRQNAYWRPASQAARP